MLENHTHNGIDSPKIRQTNLIGVYADGDLVHITGDETISGTKTFTSIPVLPSSDPTSDNQAARKKYIDDKIKATEVVASDNLRDSANTTRSTTNTTYTKLKEFKFNEVDGEIRIKFDLSTSGLSGTDYARIYINGVAVGTERSSASTTPVTYSEDLSVNKNDLVQLYAKHSTGAESTIVSDFKLYYDHVFTVTSATVNDD